MYVSKGGVHRQGFIPSDGHRFVYGEGQAELRFDWMMRLLLPVVVVGLWVTVGAVVVRVTVVAVVVWVTVVVVIDWFIVVVMVVWLYIAIGRGWVINVSVITVYGVPIG